MAWPVPSAVEGRVVTPSSRTGRLSSTAYRSHAHIQEVAETTERLKSAKIRIGTNDLRIAAIVLAYDALLLTRNLADFCRVPRLRAEDWSA
jgi:predicted nucleic acid-binding protein